jgi:RNA polymerase sigma-70 factor (ECF subfamily)
MGNVVDASRLKRKRGGPSDARVETVCPRPNGPMWGHAEVERVAMSAGDPTSSSLLRCALAREPGAWERLVALYSPVVSHWCRQAGIPDHDIQDVAQEVFAAVSMNLAKFRADRPGTTFRAWMRGIARHKLRHYLDDRGEPAAGGTDAQKRLHQIPAPSDDIELSEGPADIAGVYQRALGLVRGQFEERTWNAFWRVAVEDRTPAEVGAEMGITPNAVRQAKSRVLRRLREEMGDLIA